MPVKRNSLICAITSILTIVLLWVYGPRLA
jgi:hypothetical protein